MTRTDLLGSVMMILTTISGTGIAFADHGDGPVTACLGQPRFDSRRLFDSQRFPNVAIAKDGTVLATWGREGVRVRRSEDGGETWGDPVTIAPAGFQGGGLTVDDLHGDVLAFVEEAHPPSPLHIYRSTDHGKSWQPQDVVIEPDTQGHVPSMHMNEHGITLRRGPHAGRLIRPARVYANYKDQAEWINDYTTAIYSDDGGKTWRTSDPFPARGTGEAAIAELADGRIYYNSRRHRAPAGENPRRRWTAWSRDGGATWTDLAMSEVLPDGDQDRDYGLMGGLVRLPVEGHDILLFSNIESPSGRQNGMVWVSFDGGATWPVKRRITPGKFAYSSLAAGRPGTPSEGWIYLLYEEGTAAGYLARFNLSWLLEGDELSSLLPSHDGRTSE